MTREEIRTEIRRLVEDVVLATAAANESAQCQAQLAELEAAIAELEASADSHYGMDAGDDAPWSFACTIEEGGEGEEETRTGGWYNCRAQIGFDIWGSPDTSVPDHLILGTDQCDDGSYYLEVVLANNTEGRESDAAEIKLAADMDSTASDYIGGIIRIFIGTVADGKLVNAPHFNPVVYKYV